MDPDTFNYRLNLFRLIGMDHFHCAGQFVKGRQLAIWATTIVIYIKKWMEVRFGKCWNCKIQANFQRKAYLIKSKRKLVRFTNMEEFCYVSTGSGRQGQESVSACRCRVRFWGKLACKPTWQNFTTLQPTHNLHSLFYKKGDNWKNIWHITMNAWNDWNDWKY